MTVSPIISRRFVRAPRGRPLFIPALYTVKNQDAVLNPDTSSISETMTVPAAVIAQDFNCRGCDCLNPEILIKPDIVIPDSTVEKEVCHSRPPPQQ
jgi:hypothetical protein